MVFASDTRTNAGVDNIASFRKMYIFSKDGDRVIVMLTAGNLSITQSAIKLLEEHVRRETQTQTVTPKKKKHTRQTRTQTVTLQPPTSTDTTNGIQ